ncbi:hypothetical protein BD413DRAFT_520574 [Trametes elegans]|nr:hypothetical protein BD413DRAFT_520574 [Trametes elegans]
MTIPLTLAGSVNLDGCVCQVALCVLWRLPQMTRADSSNLDMSDLSGPSKGTLIQGQNTRTPMHSVDRERHICTRPETRETPHTPYDALTRITTSWTVKTRRYRTIYLELRTAGYIQSPKTRTVPIFAHELSSMLSGCSIPSYIVFVSIGYLF